MNEYVDPYSPARLIGTFDQPEGLLTAAVRRQPFCGRSCWTRSRRRTPAVFDLLLQVLGEGRLTDSLGRTADFGNAIVIMTSNLGSRAGTAAFGLRPAGRSDRDAYVDAAEAFFRPSSSTASTGWSRSSSCRATTWPASPGGSSAICCSATACCTASASSGSIPQPWNG